MIRLEFRLLLLSEKSACIDQHGSVVSICNWTQQEISKIVVFAGDVVTGASQLGTFQHVSVDADKQLAPRRFGQNFVRPILRGGGGGCQFG